MRSRHSVVKPTKSSLWACVYCARVCLTDAELVTKNNLRFLFFLSFLVCRSKRPANSGEQSAASHGWNELQMYCNCNYMKRDNKNRFERCYVTVVGKQQLVFQNVRCGGFKICLYMTDSGRKWPPPPLPPQLRPPNTNETLFSVLNRRYQIWEPLSWTAGTLFLIWRKQCKRWTAFVFLFFF